jgi:hypothetical protein
MEMGQPRATQGLDLVVKIPISSINELSTVRAWIFCILAICLMIAARLLNILLRPDPE